MADASVRHDTLTQGRARIRTLLTAGELGALATDFRVETFGQRLDEVEDVCVPASGFDLLLRHLFPGLDGTKEDVEAHSAGVQCRLL